MRLAVILIHYHTEELVARAVAALRKDAGGLEVEWLLVDNGSDETGRRIWEGLGVERIDPGRNLGYAGGVNAGVARSRADAILLMNPDVLVLPGCLPALLESLRAGAAVAGPRFYWDEGRQVLLPPAEVRTRREELVRLLASRGGGWARWARRRWRRHARRHWLARAPLASHALSGSLLALWRSTWERVGPFDEEFRLYFEETDWLLRARRLGLPAVYVPAAEAVHLHAESSRQVVESQRWFEESAARFRELHYGRWFTRGLRLAGRVMAARSQAARGAHQPEECAEARHRNGSGASESPLAGLVLVGEEEAADDREVWLEIAPVPGGVPAAGQRWRGGGRWRLPEEVEKRLGAGTELWVRVSDGEGREGGCHRLVVGRREGPRG